ncbi:hypothetical protein QW180_12465 [Vibrio sinaloensis]|nr:hypothetical protein [Vibrio sinaloensis]
MTLNNAAKKPLRRQKNVNGSLDVMVGSIARINDLGVEIATAASQQSAVTDEVSRNMTTIQTMVEELTANGSQALEGTMELANNNQKNCLRL